MKFRTVALLLAAALPLAAQNLLTNGDFEASPALTAWTGTATTVTTGALEGASSVSTALIYQDIAPDDIDSLLSFEFNCLVRLDTIDATQRIRFRDHANAGDIITLRFSSGGVDRFSGTWANAVAYPIVSGGTYHVRVTASNLDQSSRSYLISISEDGINYTNSSPQTGFHSATPLALETIRLESNFGGGVGGATWDALTLTGTTVPPPPADKVVNIAGVYPHLAMTNNDLECGPGAIVPFADRLWCVTYSPHSPNGSSSKLYEIDSSFARTIRPESLGGTPANRFIHQPSNQLIIGPHFIDANRNVRNLPYSVAPGRHTGVAAHLTDPDNRLYIMTMENGVYDVDVNDLSVITRYPDRKATGDRFLFGYHGKGLYSGQGLLIAANNGRPNNQGVPTGESGVLATWDGTTVADNGGSYLVNNDPNTAEPSSNPVTAQPEYIAGWNQLHKVQTCEVTGPGGITGNPNPATDPIWTTAFDAKSVILRTLENGTWHTYRLPKGSYSHDGSHGWHTEWPRIRQLDPATPGSPYLMHMHGLFYDFPSSFSATNFGDLTPLCSYYKMPVDYCMYEGQLVIAKNDASKFDNALAQKAQSNLWFGQLEDLQSWGAPSGHGAIWLNDAVTSEQTSDPFLAKGFAHRTLHLRNNAASPVTVAIETSTGDGQWSTLTTAQVPANGYLPENLSANSAPWIRLKANNACDNLTAFFHFGNSYPHSPIASLGTDKFAALADIRDTTESSDGTIRVMAGNDLKLEMATLNGYHQVGGDMVLTDVENASLESSMRTNGALTKEFGSDEASAWIESGGVRFRLPKLDPLYDRQFASGWARGFREAVTERELLNCHGTFYEVPRSNSGGYRKMRALTTHGKRITDFASWRGLFVLTGVLNDSPASDSLLKNEDGSAALWLGEIDDLWQMGEPRGKGGPWSNSSVTANSASDPYLMYGYDKKVLELSHDSANPVTFTVEVDFLADNTWSAHQQFTVPAGETVTHEFPAGFHAHWVRLKSDTATNATAQFTYGPADRRDAFLDWGRDQGLSTANGRQALATSNPDGDELMNYAEFALGTSPLTENGWPLALEGDGVSLIRRTPVTSEPISATLETSEDLSNWESAESQLVLASEQGGLSGEQARFLLTFTSSPDALFARILVSQ